MSDRRRVRATDVEMELEIDHIEAANHKAQAEADWWRRSIWKFALVQLGELSDTAASGEIPDCSDRFGGTPSMIMQAFAAELLANQNAPEGN